jgi:type I restriction enzyme, S subunit
MSEWEITSLCKVADIERSTVDPATIEDSTTYVGLENIETGGTFVNVRSVASGELASSKFKFTSQHVLYGKLRPYLAKIARPTFSGICSTDILPILPKPKLDKDYLTHFLRQPSMIDLATSRSIGANLPRLSPKVLAEFQIPLPPIAQQKRIAAILDQAEALRSHRREAIGLLDELGRSVFLEMFGDPAINSKGWQKFPLSHVTRKFSDGPFGSNLKTSHYVESGIRVIRLQNIGVSEFIDDNHAYVSTQHFNTLKKHECLPGDVLIATLGEPNLRACIQPGWLEV